jgi:hypothetical protein
LDRDRGDQARTQITRTVIKRLGSKVTFRFMIITAVHESNSWAAFVKIENLQIKSCHLDQYPKKQTHLCTFFGAQINAGYFVIIFYYPRQSRTTRTSKLVIVWWYPSRCGAVKIYFLQTLWR